MANIKIGYWFNWFPWPRKKWKVALRVTAADEIPPRIPPKCAVLVQNHTQASWIAFDCPCKRGHRVMLNLSPERQPCWTLGSTALLTLAPSIDDHSIDDQCHYFIREGRVEWASSYNNHRR